MTWADTVLECSLPPDYRRRRSFLDGVLKQREPLKEPLLPLQRLSVANAAALKYSCIFDDMGLGKTAQALAVDAIGGHENTLILCPNQVKTVWQHEICKFTDYRLRDIYVGKGRELVDMPAKVASRFKFIIFNYEALNVGDKAGGIIPNVLRVCTHHILDEVHKLRNAESKKTMYYKLMAREVMPDSMTMLTGTPIDRFIGELYVYLSLLDKNPGAKKKGEFGRYFPNAISFADRYGLSNDKSGAVGLRAYSGAKFTPQVGAELLSLMGPRFVQRKKQEVVDLPPVKEQKIMIPDASFTHLDMNKVREDFIAAFRLAHSSRNRARKWEKAGEGEGGSGMDPDMLFMAQTQKIRRSIGEAKVPYTLGRAVEKRKRLGPVIIFSEFLSPLDIFAANASRGGFKSVLAVGQGRMPLYEREENIRRFKEGKYDFLLATYGAMSEGVNLQQFRAMEFNDISWQPLVMMQAMCRIWRIGQENEVEMGYSLCSADEVILNTLEKKGKMIKAFEGLLSEIKVKEGFV